MQPASYAFKLGAFECTILKDTVHTYENPARFLFYNAPRFHFPFPGLGYIIESEEGHRWLRLSLEDDV